MKLWSLRAILQRISRSMYLSSLCKVCEAEEFMREVAAYHREELDVQNQRSVEEPAKKFLELCLIHSMHLM
ncbi:hypothetical protein YC2023_015192 [Brassica napus]